MKPAVYLFIFYSLKRFWVDRTLLVNGYFNVKNLSNSSFMNYPTLMLYSVNADSVVAVPSSTNLEFACTFSFIMHFLANVKCLLPPQSGLGMKVVMLLLQTNHGLKRTDLHRHIEHISLCETQKVLWSSHMVLYLTYSDINTLTEPVWWATWTSSIHTHTHTGTECAATCVRYPVEHVFVGLSLHLSQQTHSSSVHCTNQQFFLHQKSSIQIRT
jgi:hypothetical protein